MIIRLEAHFVNYNMPHIFDGTVSFVNLFELGGVLRDKRSRNSRPFTSSNWRISNKFLGYRTLTENILNSCKY